MNFLQLCQRTREKCGISGSGPASVTGQSGEMLRIVNWVKESWLDIQNERTNWMWMRGEVSFSTIASQQAYTPTEAGIASTFGRWWPDTIRVYRTAVGLSDEQHLHPTGYSEFRDVYQFSTRLTGRPTAVSVRPSDQALLLGPVPVAIHTVAGEYQKRAWDLSANVDEPDMPLQFHMLVVYGAMRRYAYYEGAPEVLAGSTEDDRRLRSQLMDSQLPPFELEGAMA